MSKNLKEKKMEKESRDTEALEGAKEMIVQDAADEHMRLMAEFKRRRQAHVYAIINALFVLILSTIASVITGDPASGIYVILVTFMYPVLYRFFGGE